jgi:hypothetical protein
MKTAIKGLKSSTPNYYNEFVSVIVTKSKKRKTSNQSDEDWSTGKSGEVNKLVHCLVLFLN